MSKIDSFEELVCLLTTIEDGKIQVGDKSILLKGNSLDDIMTNEFELLVRTLLVNRKGALGHPYPMNSKIRTIARMVAVEEKGEEWYRQHKEDLKQAIETKLYKLGEKGKEAIREGAKEIIQEGELSE